MSESDDAFQSADDGESGDSSPRAASQKQGGASGSKSDAVSPKDGGGGKGKGRRKKQRGRRSKGSAGDKEKVEEKQADESTKVTKPEEEKKVDDDVQVLKEKVEDVSIEDGATEKSTEKEEVGSAQVASNVPEKVKEDLPPKENVTAEGDTKLADKAVVDEPKKESTAESPALSTEKAEARSALDKLTDDGGNVSSTSTRK